MNLLQVSELADQTDEMLAELKKIRQLQEPKPAPPPPKGMRAEFSAFIKKYQVMGIAVAFILGIYLGAVVQGLVNYILMPIIQLVLPGTSCRAFRLGHSKWAHLEGRSSHFSLWPLSSF